MYSFKNLEGDAIIILIFCKESLIVKGLKMAPGDEDSGCSKIMRKGVHGYGLKVVICKAYHNIPLSRII